MADFRLAIPEIKKHEGGLSKNPRDNAARYPVPDGSGNHTNRGITWQTFVSGQHKYHYKATPALFYEMPDWLWSQLYKGEYWDKIQGDKIKSTAIAFAMVDFAFNSGPDDAVRQMQQALNKNFGFALSQDGVIGAKTIAAINQVAEKTLLDAYTAERKDFVLSSGAIHDSLNAGLINRINKIYASAGKYIVPAAGGALFFCLLGWLS